MEDKKKVVVAQKMKFKDELILDKAIRYYSMFFAINKKKIPNKEIELLAFTAVRGTITPLPARKEFVEKFKSSLASVENIKGSLVKKGLLVEIDGKYRVNPKINVDFNKTIVLRIDLI